MAKNYKLTTSIVLAASILAAACNSNGEKHRTPGRIYAPDMTYSRAYDYYNANPNFADGHTARIPVQGTVARGHELPDHMVEGDTNGYKSFTTTARFDEAQLGEGKRLYNIYCGICHGTNLDGNGPLYNGGNGKFAAAPANFKLEKYLNMPVGQMYAAIKFGKNAMGSYASQLDIHQRWMVIAYIKQAQSQNGGAAFTMGTAAVKPGGGTGKLQSDTTGSTSNSVPTTDTTAKPHGTPQTAKK
jgi:mono/diheme cytochrome c family protein